MYLPGFGNRSLSLSSLVLGSVGVSAGVAYDSLPASLSFLLEVFQDSSTSFVALPSGCQDLEQVFGDVLYSLDNA